MIGDLLSSWEIKKKKMDTDIKRVSNCRVYLSLSFFPNDNIECQYLLEFVTFELMFNAYYDKMSFERFRLVQLFGKCF